MIDFNPTEQKVSLKIHPNLSTWQTLEISFNCAEYAVKNGVEGDFVECGIAAGNNLAAMCMAGRKGWGFDSFEGIPWAGQYDKFQPGIGRTDKSKIGILESSGVSSYPMEAAEKNFRAWEIDNYEFIKGWFQDTVKDWEGVISVLRLDGDLYDSTLVCLFHLYPKLSKGGILIIDDWNLAGCRQAFWDYFGNHAPEHLHNNGRTYWKK